MTSALDGQSLDRIFRSARTPNGWADRPVEDDTLREIYDLMKRGPTSANSDCAVEMHIVGLCPQIVMIAGFDFDFRSGDTIHTESSRKYDAESFARLAELGGWRVAEIWTDAERLFAVFGLVAAKPAQGS